MSWCESFRILTGCPSRKAQQEILIFPLETKSHFWFISWRRLDAYRLGLTMLSFRPKTAESFCPKGKKWGFFERIEKKIMAQCSTASLLCERCERLRQSFHGSSTYIRDERWIELNKNIYFCLAMTLGVKLLSNLLNFRAKRRLSLPISGFVSRKSSLTCDDKSEAKKEQVILDDKS